MEKWDIKIDAKVIKILDIVSDEDLDVSSQILARAMVVNYDTRVNKQEGTEKPQLAPGLKSEATSRR